MDVYFSDVFRVDESHIQTHGAFNVSLVNDLPLFVDPFLLFNSSNAVYQQLHRDMIQYVCFLRDRVVEAGSEKIAPGLVEAWFHFPEVRQNWFGYSISGNCGRGLGPDFAQSLLRNLSKVFSNFGSEHVSRGSHLEKLSLIDNGIGRDMISDFTTNLIKKFLCEYTQKFSRQYLGSDVRKTVVVKKVWFNYETRTWVDEAFDLPFHRGNYVVLTPTDILTKDETWINRDDLLTRIQNIVEVIPNTQLRHEFNQYLTLQLAKAKTPKEKRAAIPATLQEFPELLDYYIQAKENKGDEAEAISQKKVRLTYDRYVGQIRRFVESVLQPAQFYKSQATVELLNRYRTAILKRVIEDGDAKDLLYSAGRPISNQNELVIILRMIWAANLAEGGFEASFIDESLRSVSFKLASNSKLADAARKFLDEDASRAGIFVIFAFTGTEAERVTATFDPAIFPASERIVCINAATDPSQSGTSQSRSKEMQMAKCRILMLSANPEGTTPLALDEECREIERKLRASDYRDHVQLSTKWAVQADDLLQYLNELKPDVVHFSGHGSPSNEIILVDAIANRIAYRNER